MRDDRLLSCVRVALHQQQLFRTTACLVVAVSGGPDSLCLLHLLWRLRQAGGPALHVAHLDHGFRGAQSADEACFVAATARAWGLPITLERYDVPALAARLRRNRQAVARMVRYAFLARVTRNAGAAAVAVAHQADDQAETVLLHLLRGAGPAGLRGMRAAVPWSEWHHWFSAEQDHLPPGDPLAGALPDSAVHAPGPLLIRPLLEVTRAQIEQYTRSHDLAPRIDPSNASHSYTRNRIRTDLLPYLARYNPQVVDVLQRTARICADDYAFIQAQLDTVWPELASVDGGGVRFDISRWQQLPPALQRYALRRAAFHLLHTDELGYDQVEAGRHAATQRAGYRHTLGGGLMLHVDQNGFLITAEDQAPVPDTPDAVALPQLATDELPLALPGTTWLSPHWSVTLQWSSSDPAAAPGMPGRHWMLAVDADTLDGRLILRRRRPGDRFRPAGGIGSRRLQDFFVDRKLPRELRAGWPLLATPTSIVWVAGLRADERFLVTPNTQRPLWVWFARCG